MASGRLELPRPCGQQILSLPCLPIPPRGRTEESTRCQPTAVLSQFRPRRLCPNRIRLPTAAASVVPTLEVIRCGVDTSSFRGGYDDSIGRCDALHARRTGEIRADGPVHVIGKPL